MKNIIICLAIVAMPAFGLVISREDEEMRGASLHSASLQNFCKIVQDERAPARPDVDAALAARELFKARNRVESDGLSQNIAQLETTRIDLARHQKQTLTARMAPLQSVVDPILRAISALEAENCDDMELRARYSLYINYEEAFVESGPVHDIRARIRGRDDRLRVLRAQLLEAEQRTSIANETRRAFDEVAQQFAPQFTAIDVEIETTKSAFANLQVAAAVQLGALDGDVHRAQEAYIRSFSPQALLSTIVDAADGTLRTEDVGILGDLAMTQQAALDSLNAFQSDLRA